MPHFNPKQLIPILAATIIVTAISIVVASRMPCDCEKNEEHNGE